MSLAQKLSSPAPGKLLGSESGELLIVGGGRHIWSDVCGLPEFSHVMVVNDIGMYWPGRIRHWYSNEIEQLIHWEKCRRIPYRNHWGTGWKLHSCCERDWIDNVYHWGLPGNGGSGLMAIIVALLLGYDSITVAGIPFDDSGHFYDPPELHNLRKDEVWSHFSRETPDHFIQPWLPYMRGKVRAVSGRLTEVLNGA